MSITNTNKKQGTRENDHYATPEKLYHKLDSEFHFTFDPCPFHCNQFDGLKVPWYGSIFCNPPYSHIETWLTKAIEEIKAGNCKRVVFLIPAYISSLYWHRIILEYSSEIRLVAGKLIFQGQKYTAPLHFTLVIFDYKLSGSPKFISYKQ